MQSVRNVPSLSSAEFTAACHWFVEAALKVDNLPFSCVEFTDGLALRIETVIPSNPESAQDAVREEVDEQDDPAVIQQLRRPDTRICFEVVLSPSYQVPVLYLAISNGNSTATSLDRVYSLLVPDHPKAQLTQVGVMGAISMGDHPVTGMPAFFVHPCNTAQAMADALTSKPVTPREYLLVWFGLVGPCLGLYVPVEMVAQN